MNKIIRNTIEFWEDENCNKWECSKYSEDEAMSVADAKNEFNEIMED